MCRNSRSRFYFFKFYADKGIIELSRFTAWFVKLLLHFGFILERDWLEIQAVMRKCLHNSWLRHILYYLCLSVLAVGSFGNLFFLRIRLNVEIIMHYLLCCLYSGIDFQILAEGKRWRINVWWGVHHRFGILPTERVDPLHFLSITELTARRI